MYDYNVEPKIVKHLWKVEEWTPHHNPASPLRHIPNQWILANMQAFVMWIQHNSKHVVCHHCKKCFTKFEEWSKNFDNHACHTRIQSIKFKVKINVLEWWIWHFTICSFACNLTKINIATIRASNKSQYFCIWFKTHY